MDADALTQAAAALRTGALERCLTLAQGALECPAAPPDLRAEALMLMGVARLRLGSLAAAARAFTESLELRERGLVLVQLSHAQRYLGAFGAALETLERAQTLAQAGRDAGLMLALLLARGEAHLAQGDPHEALLAFGEALGLSELSRDERLSVLPLAGLGQAQAAWGYPAKGERMAAKALERAERHGDGFGRARALLALGVTTRDAARLTEAERLAEALPHRPLAALASALRQEISDPHS